MQILGIGPLELVFILIIALLVLGPRGMVKTARQAGDLIRKVVKSPMWREVVDTSREIRELPTKLAREAGVEKELDLLRRAASGNLPPSDENQLHSNEHNLLPPEAITDVPSQSDLPKE